MSPLSASVPRAAIVAVGDELLLGDTVDTNSAWLGRRLADLGVPVTRRWTVGDAERDVCDGVGAAIASAEAVLVTGGLGPTPDDRTREAVAGLLGRSMSVDQGVLRELKRRFAERGHGELPESNVRQARRIEGATILANGLGTAPGQALEVASTLLVLLPGVPRELMHIMDEHVERLLLDRFKDRLQAVRHRRIFTTGIAESVLAETVERALPSESGPVSVAYLPGLGAVEIRLTVSGFPEAEAEAALDRVEGVLAPLVEDYRYESVRGDLAEALSDALLASSKTLAVAESCTGGLVAQRITDVPGASRFFMGGVVAYENRVKVEVLGVSPETIEACGAVSEEVADAMARGVAGRLRADAGIGVTGVAGPSGGTDEKPVGTVVYAAHLDGRTAIETQRFPGDRGAVRARAAQAAMALLLRMVVGRR